MIWTVFFLSLHAASVCGDRAEVLPLDGSIPFYTEERMRTPCEGTRVRDSVRYVRPDGRLLGSKVIEWRANQDLPAFELKLDSPLRRVSVAYDNDTARIELDRKGRRERHRVPLPAGTVVDAGIDTWIARNLALLDRGMELEVPVLVPEFHRVLTFSVKKIAADPVRPDETRIELKPTSWILRTLSTPLVVSYRRNGAELKAFRGVSDVKGADGKNFKVSMRYRGWVKTP